MKQAYYNFEFGKLHIGYEGKILLLLKAEKDSGVKSEGERSPFSDLVYTSVCEFISGKRKDFGLSFRLEGTDFQKAVWNALLNINYGETKTYGEIAAEIGRPKAARAVGSACGKNRLWLIVPCHRAVASNSLGGYAGGIEMKKALLDTEKASRNAFS
ncbi:MAG: methylated-DNA--[protein]-cysteine S-methyltransferase [Clostridiales bacterium]|nr:methylated-DNA--[protein]-cysteine S-methyltransferase [Clostridiales bacterium]